MRPPFPPFGIILPFGKQEDQKSRQEHRWSHPVFAGISASSPFSSGPGKGSQQQTDEQKTKGGKGGKAGKDGDVKQNSKSPAESQKEERHRKDDAAGRSNNKGDHGGRDKDKSEKSSHAEQHKARDEASEKQKGSDKQKDNDKLKGNDKQKAGGTSTDEKTPMHANVARGLAGIWKEISEESGEGRSSDEDSRQSSSAQPERDAEGVVEDAAPVARIVAYSDSDSDEPLPLPFQKQRDKGPTGASSDADADEASTSSAAAGGGRQRWLWRSLSKHLPEEVSQDVKQRGAVTASAAVARRLGSRQMSSLKDGSALAFLLKILLVALLRRFRPKAVASFELLSLAVPLPDALASWMRRPPVSDSFPAGMRRAARHLTAFSAPLLVSRLVRQAVALLRRKPQRPVRRSISESVLVLREMAGEEEGSGQQELPGGPLLGAPEFASQLAAHRAALHAAELGEMVRVLDAQGVKLPPDRFDSSQAELLRYAASCGLLEASSPEQQAVAIEAASHSILETMQWRQKRKFMTPQQLQPWDQLIQWHGSDAEGHPILLVHLAKLCNVCSSAEHAQQAADAVISQVELAVRRRLDNEVGPDQLVAVVDAQGASALQVTRKVTLLKETALALNKHFPGRLHRLYVVGLPASLAWVVDTIRPVLHPTTAANIRICTADDASVPLPPHVLNPAPDSPCASVDAMPNGTDTESDYNTPRSTLTLPDVPELSATSVPAPSMIRTTTPPPAEAAGTSGGGGRKRVFIPESPVTPVTEQKTPRPLRRTASWRSAGSAEPSPRLRPSLKRASYTSGVVTAGGGGSADFARPAPSALRRSSSFPKSHSLARTLSLGDILADKEALDAAEIEASCKEKAQE